MNNDTELMRSVIVTFNGEWGFLKSPFPEKWGGRHIYFNTDGGRYATSSGIQVRFSKTHPKFPWDIPTIPNIGDELVFHTITTARGPKASRWCKAEEWDNVEPSFFTGRMSSEPILEKFGFARELMSGDRILVHVDNWRPVQICDNTVFIDPQDTTIRLSSNSYPQSGDMIVFQGELHAAGMRAIPWSYQDDWADALFKAQNRS